MARARAAGTFCADLAPGRDSMGGDERYRVVEAAGIPAWDDEADVIVVGYGAAGACAAIEAREAGADVLVLERASGPGGLTASAAGHIYMGGGTRVQKAVGVEDRVEDMIAYLMAVTPEPDEAKIRLYCQESVAHFDWLVARGVPFKDSYHRQKNVLQMTDECLIESGNEAAWPYCEIARPAARGHKVAMEGEAGGAKLIEKLAEHARKIGVRAVYDSAVRELVRDGDRIVGVRYRAANADRAASARRAVILAAGQFGANAELIRRHCPTLADERITKHSSTYDDGAGHLLGIAAGGVTDPMEGALVTSPFYPPEDMIKGILVNREGKRFVNEDSSHSRSSLACLDHPGAVAYLIADEIGRAHV